MKEVMAIHDVVMPKMSKLGSLVGELNDKENDSTDLRIQYEQARKDLQAANKSMMDWMQNFGNRFDPDEILNGKELSDQKKQWIFGTIINIIIQPRAFIKKLFVRCRSVVSRRDRIDADIVLCPF